MKYIDELIEISKYAGERFDLIQAGGGNSSIKLDNGEMIIKASGYLLSSMSHSRGFSRVMTQQVQNIVKDTLILNTQIKQQREVIAKKMVEKATIDKKNRPSIETLLHSLLLQYTLHTHPIIINIICIQKNWITTLQKIFDTDEVLFVPYHTPGIDLAIALNQAIIQKGTLSNIIFLQNHGLIITADTKEEIYHYNEYVTQKIEHYLKIDLQRYRLTNKISKLYRKIQPSLDISYLSEDQFLNKQLKIDKTVFSEKPFCPDTFVFCGINAVFLNNLDDITSIKDYYHQYNLLPKVIIYKQHLIIRAANINKAREVEEVLKFHIMLFYQNSTTQLNPLDREELNYLAYWEAESFRQNL